MLQRHQKQSGLVKIWESISLGLELYPLSPAVSLSHVFAFVLSIYPPGDVANFSCSMIVDSPIILSYFATIFNRDLRTVSPPSLSLYFLYCLVLSIFNFGPNTNYLSLQLNEESTKGKSNSKFWYQGIVYRLQHLLDSSSD
jgi:hypothetical protein